MLVALAFGLQAFVLQLAVFGGEIAWWRPFLINLLSYQFWWLLTPLVLALGRRFPLDTSEWKGNLVVAPRLRRRGAVPLSHAVPRFRLPVAAAG